MFHATNHAIGGLRKLLKEKSAKREVILTLVAGIIFPYSSNSYSPALLLLTFLLLAESLNAAIENICDPVFPGRGVWAVFYSKHLQEKAAKALL